MGVANYSRPRPHSGTNSEREKMDSESPLPNGSEGEQRAEPFGGGGPAVVSTSAAADRCGDDQGESQGVGGVEVEMMEEDHFEFLDKVTQLGSLRSGACNS